MKSRLIERFAYFV